MPWTLPGPPTRCAIIHASPEGRDRLSHPAHHHNGQETSRSVALRSRLPCPCGGIGTERPKPIPNPGLKIRVNYWVHTGRHRPRVLIRHLVSHNLSRSCPQPLLEGSLLPRSSSPTINGHCLGLTYGRSMRNMKKTPVFLSSPVQLSMQYLIRQLPGHKLRKRKLSSCNQKHSEHRSNQSYH
jgi:hypothetical protein